VLALSLSLTVGRPLSRRLLELAGSVMSISLAGLEVDLTGNIGSSHNKLKAIFAINAISNYT